MRSDPMLSVAAAADGATSRPGAQPRSGEYDVERSTGRSAAGARLGLCGGEGPGV